MYLAWGRCNAVERAISEASPVKSRPWLKHPYSLWSAVQRWFLFVSKQAPLGLTPPLVISLLLYSLLSTPWKQASPKLAGVHPKIPFSHFWSSSVLMWGKEMQRHGQSLGIALQRLQLWDRAVLSPKPCSLLTVGLVFFPPLGGGGEEVEAEVWVFDLGWFFFSVVVWKKFTTNTQTKTREYMSGSLGVQGTAHQTSIYIQTPVI